MIRVKWRFLQKYDPGWGYRGCLYAYLTPSGKEILYIGKTWGTTVEDRWNKKLSFWKDLERQRGIRGVIPLVGEICLPDGLRLTRELLADIESLLIYIEKPWGNIQCQQKRIRRPGMQVKCTGNWPGTQKTYTDNNKKENAFSH
jgi:hypothetical protein